MPTHALLIEVRLLSDRYHGVGDWPPSPFRLFQAMVAGAYGGRWVTEPRQIKDVAFQWLEALAPPCIVAPAHVRTRPVQTFVPNNDLDALGGDPRRVGETRVSKQTEARLLADDTPLTYAWPFDDAGTHSAGQICDLAERLHTFGRGVDGAFARARTLGWDAALDTLRQTGSVAFPSPLADGGRGVRCPAPGSLRSLIERYTRGSKQLERRADGTASSLFRQPPRARCTLVAYDRPPTRYVFDIRPGPDDSTFRALPLIRVVEVATALRDLAFARLSRAMPDRNAELERVLIGRGTPPPSPTRRVRFLPLPSTGSRHADASIRRVLVQVPPECPCPPADIAWSLAGQSIERYAVTNQDTGEFRDALLVASGDHDMLRHYGVGRSARRWQSVTPVALPRHTRPAQSGVARIATNVDLVAAVADALRHAGFPYRAVHVRVQQEPFSRHGSVASASASGRFKPTALHHVEVTFPTLVEGPVVIGDGRWLGLGLMAPAREDVRSLHGYRITGGTWPTGDSTPLLRALRRAVMARVGADLGNRRLDTFFSGHQDTAAPARGDSHGHLFYLAHDTDGDGALDYVAIMAPHLADRRADTTRSLPNRRLLARALEGLRTVRAGHLGVLSLTPLDSPPANLFGRTRTWESMTPYRPTRHPKNRMDVEAAVAFDVQTECARRGLPQPWVRILEALTGPREGLRCRVRLRFPSAVMGPIVLGAGSHFGEGLFGVGGETGDEE